MTLLYILRSLENTFWLGKKNVKKCSGWHHWREILIRAIIVCLMHSNRDFHDTLLRFLNITFHFCCNWPAINIHQSLKELLFFFFFLSFPWSKNDHNYYRPAHGLSHSYSIHWSALNLLWNHMVWSREAKNWVLYWGYGSIVVPRNA